MATSGYGGDDDNNIEEGLMKWPLEYAPEIKEYTCGWCGQQLTASHHDLAIHFKSCKKSKEDGLSLVFKELIRMNQKFDGLEADTRKKVDEMKAEVMEEVKTEVLNVETKIRKEIEGKKIEFKNELDKLGGETRFGALSTLLRKVKSLEEGMKEKMAEVNGRVSGVIEAVTSVVHNMLKGVKKKEMSSSADTVLSNEPDRSKNETEALWVQLRKNEEDIRATKTQLEDEVAHLKTRQETLTKQMTTNDRDLRVLKRQNEKLVTEKCFHVEQFDQLAIPMNSFNLATHNYLFQPSFRWTIDGIEAKMSRETFELTSQMFQWNGYPVQTRAKLQLKKDGYVYVSLCWKDELKDESAMKDFTTIPHVFYLLKDFRARNPKHLCRPSCYLAGGWVSSYSLAYDECLFHNSCLKQFTYNVDDAIEIEIYVEPPLMTQQAQTYDGTLEWSIENYTRRLQFEKDGLVYNQESPYFYTGPKGYRVQVEIYLNGEAEGDGLTAYVSFLKGKFDAELPVSFPHSTTVTFLNRKEPERSVSKTIVEDIKNKGEYDFEVCRLEEVENLIENDTLFCKVVIKAQ